MFILETDGEEMAMGPLSESGTPISRIEEPPNRVIAIVPYVLNSPIIEKASDLHDVISVGNSYLLRSRICNVVQRAVLDPAMRIVDASVRNRAGESLEQYYWLTSQARHRVIDRRMATFRTFPGSDIIADVTKRVLDGHAIPSYDMFWGEDFKWYVSSKLRDSLVSLAPTGCRFEEVAINH